MHFLLQGLPENAAVSGSERLVLSLTYQLIAIIFVTRIVVWFSSRFLGQTDVSGEILAGLVLGPSCLGALFPMEMKALFPSATTDVLVALSHLGLIFLMFEVGLRFEFSSTFESAKRGLVAISLCGMAVPFVLGLLTASWFWDRMPAASRPPLLGFELFFAVAISITAIPVLGRIFLELDLSHTRIAALVLGAAALDDVGGWILLSVVSAIVQSRFSSQALLMRILALIVFLAGLKLISRPVRRMIANSRARTGHLSGTTISIVVALTLLCAAITSNTGVFAIIGAFCFGLTLHQDRQFVADWSVRFSAMVRAVLLPLFFTYTGLRTDIGYLGSAQGWMLCLGVLAVAFAGKFGGTYAAARLSGEPPRLALIVGVCMNTRGLMELIALNVGYDLGVVPRPMFTMLVIMALASTFVATPLVRRLMKDQMHAMTVEPVSQGIAQGVA